MNVFISKGNLACYMIGGRIKQGGKADMVPKGVTELRVGSMQVFITRNGSAIELTAEKKNSDRRCGGSMDAMLQSVEGRSLVGLFLSGEISFGGKVLGLLSFLKAVK